MLSTRRSVFPYSMVPMTRLDPVSKKQVVMHFQNEEFYVQRPLVIARSEEPASLFVFCGSDSVPL